MPESCQYIDVTEDEEGVESLLVCGEPSTGVKIVTSSFNGYKWIVRACEKHGGGGL